MSQRKFSKNIINTQSPSAHTPTNRKKGKSPFSSSKCCHDTNPKQTVSYGELQIVLENIQAIKQKATSQVKQLSEQNIQLREQVAQMQKCIQTLTFKTQHTDQLEIQIQQKWRTRITMLEEESRQKTKRIEEKDVAIDILKDKLNETQNQLHKEKEGHNSSLKDLEDMKKKWTWAFSVLAGDQTRAEEIVWKIKHSSCNLWQLFQKIASLEAILDLKIQKIESITAELAQTKLAHQKTTEMLDKSLNELNAANERIKSSELQLREYYQQILSHKDQHVIVQGHLQRLQLDKNALIHSKQQLQEQVRLLSHQIVSKQMISVKKDKRIEYNNLVAGVCDESEDYGKVIDRLRYLQRFRKEHYFNVEKIQYLCKLLDN